MDQIKKLPAEWEEIDGIHILDPDGWRNAKKPWNEPVTRTEFDQLLSGCTYGKRRP